jgi:hypothetical protein
MPWKIDLLHDIIDVEAPSRVWHIVATDPVDGRRYRHLTVAINSPRDHEAPPAMVTLRDRLAAIDPALLVREPFQWNAVPQNRLEWALAEADRERMAEAILDDVGR